MSEERFDRIDAGLKKLTVLHEETRDRVKLLAEGVGATNERIDRLKNRMDERFDDVDRRFDGIDQRLHRMETSLTRHDTGLTALEKRPLAKS
jgi:hypothetical protein